MTERLNGLTAEDRRRLEELIAKWQSRAEPNFADPEASEDTLAYWSGVKAVLRELTAAVAIPDAPAESCSFCGKPPDGGMIADDLSVAICRSCIALAAYERKRPSLPGGPQ